MNSKQDQPVAPAVEADHVEQASTPVNIEKGDSSAVRLEDCTVTTGSGTLLTSNTGSVLYKFCDLKTPMCTAWEEDFKDYIPEKVRVYNGDIFKKGPSADAIVSPANSFGFMDGGIDLAYTRHFGQQMQNRLQKVIREDYHGELLVGDAVIIPTCEGTVEEASIDWSNNNEGKPIKWLISAPTMRVPLDVSETVNAYLAFRAVILAVQKHNSTAGKDPIQSVLCPGLGTAVGRMPSTRCAYQMFQAFETYELGLHTDRMRPQHLGSVWNEHDHLSQYKRPPAQASGNTRRDIPKETAPGKKITSAAKEKPAVKQTTREAEQQKTQDVPSERKKAETKRYVKERVVQKKDK